MVSRRSVLASVGTAVGLAGCSVVDSAGDTALGESHIANALGSSMHQSVSTAPDELRVTLTVRDYDALESGFDAADADYDPAELRDESVPPFFDRLSETVTVSAMQSWDDVGRGRGQYVLQRGALDRDRLEDELALPQSPDDRHGSYDRYDRPAVSSSHDGPEQVAVADGEWIAVHRRPTLRGTDADVDLLTHAIDAEISGDSVENWLAEPLSIVLPAPHWGGEVDRDSTTGQSEWARLDSLRFDESTLVQTMVVAAPDAASFDEHWAATDVDSLAGGPFEDVDVRDRMAVARNRTPAAEFF